MRSIAREPKKRNAPFTEPAGATTDPTNRSIEVATKKPEVGHAEFQAAGERAMIGSILMGLVAGSRSQTPLAAVAWLARAGELPNEGPLGHILSRGWAVAGATALCIGELLGDKMRTAPDRTVAPGLAARVATGAIAGAALVPEHRQGPAALLGAAVAVGASFLTFAARRRSMERYGQRPTGAIEDALVLASAFWIASRSRRSRLGP